MRKCILLSLAAILTFPYLLKSQTAVTILPSNSVWKYIANGTNQGTSWRNASFNDVSWSSGAAQLGYGDGDESTVVPYGPSATSKYITTYFRKTVNLSGVSTLSSISLQVKRDDGIVVYINGTQRYRNNMPTGTIGYTTLASATASNDGATWNSTTIPNTAFIEGNNIIAVEIHQRSASDSDISFDMQITANQTDVIAPLLNGISPLNGSTSVNQSTNLSLTFNENIQKGTGNISVLQGPITIQTISVNDPSVVVSGNSVTINPNDFPSAANLSISIPSGVVKDLAGNNWAGTGSPSIWNFGVYCYNIGCFTSVLPSAQTPLLVLPSSHTFQVIAKQGQPYATTGSFPTNFDFTGYVPITGSSTNGKLTINHENTPAGGVSVSDVAFNSTSKLWSRTNSTGVDFSQIVRTERNCSGAITPWGTVLSGEETRNTGDVNGDGYIDTGWLVEIDPQTRQVQQYGTGAPQKLWALGRMSHENAVVSAIDQKTVYYGEDDPNGGLYKFVANTAGNLSSGTLYVLKLNAALSSGNPVSNIGIWQVVPNSTQNDRNNTYTLAASLGATIFNGVEDVEIGPDNKIYFASKGNGRIYRFVDNGSGITSFETYVGGGNYQINHTAGVTTEAWGTGNDNLAFDGDGNLWVLQDGSRNHIWVVKNGHTQAAPKVELFATTPAGCEPTGITFTPDYKYIFMSFQHPSSTNGTQTDASGTAVSINTSSTVVIARKENLGVSTIPQMEFSGNQQNKQLQAKLYPVPFDNEINLEISVDESQKITIEIIDVTGKLVHAENISTQEGFNFHRISTKSLKGVYFVRISGVSGCSTHKIISN